MNVVKEIERINLKELAMGTSGSWHDQYKDSAYVFIGGLHYGLTEGDVITIFSQYGEIVDVNMPRDKETGKTKGFAFLMYEDQRSTVLAVDNLNGASVLERTLRVDHVNNYKQKRTKNEDGTWEDPEEPSMNAKPDLIRENMPSDDDSVSTAPSIDPEDPMRDYLLAKRKEDKGKAKSKKSKKHEGETPEERGARKERKRAKREAKEKERSGRHKSNQDSRSPTRDRPRRDGEPEKRGGEHEGSRDRRSERDFRSNDRP